MTHTCEEIEWNKLKLYKENGTWLVEDEYYDGGIWSHTYLSNLSYCPYCGVKLDES